MSYPIRILIFITLIALCGCESQEFVKVQGSGVADSESYQPIREIFKNNTYYKPVSIKEGLQQLPEAMAHNIHAVNSSDLPFKVDLEQAFIVTTKDNQTNEELYQLQLTYLTKNEYDLTGESFFIVNIAQLSKDPFSNIVEKTITKDLLGNQVKVESIDDNTSLYHTIITTNGAYTYHYYNYDAKDNSIGITGTAANEIVYYHHGLFYQIGYQVDASKNNKEVHDKMVQLAKQLLIK